MLNAMVPTVADSLSGFRKIISPFVPNSLMCQKTLTLPPGSPSPTPSEPNVCPPSPPISNCFPRRRSSLQERLRELSHTLWLPGCFSGLPPGAGDRMLAEGRETCASGQFCPVPCSETQVVPGSHREMRCL